MPVGKDSKQITAVITADQYEQLQRQVKARKASGLKATISKYVAEAVVEKLEGDAMTELFQPNGH